MAAPTLAEQDREDPVTDHLGEHAHPAEPMVHQRPMTASRRRPVRPHRMRLSVQRVGLLSVARTAAVLATVIASALVLGGVGAWWMLRQAGLADGFEESVASGLGMESFSLPTGTMLLAWVGVAAVVAILILLVSLLLAIAFNGLGRSVGGVEVVARAERLEAGR